MTYTARAFGWMVVIDAPNARDALREARALTRTASLLPSDVTGVSRSTEDEIAWYRSRRDTTNQDRAIGESLRKVREAERKAKGTMSDRTYRTILTTVARVYYTDLSYEMVEDLIARGRLIPAVDDIGTALSVSPYAVMTVRLDASPVTES